MRLNARSHAELYHTRVVPSHGSSASVCFAACRARQASVLFNAVHCVCMCTRHICLYRGHMLHMLQHHTIVHTSNPDPAASSCAKLGMNAVMCMQHLVTQPPTALLRLSFIASPSLMHKSNISAVNEACEARHNVLCMAIKHTVRMYG